MEEVLLKAAITGGPVVLLVVVLAIIAVRHGIPLVREALSAHQGAIKEITGGFAAGLDRIERRADKVTGEVRRIADGIDDLRRDVLRGPAEEGAPVAIIGEASKRNTGRIRKRTLPIAVLLILVLGVMSACAPILIRQQHMARLSKGALKICQADRAKCREVLSCQGHARDAAEALQKLQEAMARGEEEAFAIAEAEVTERVAIEVCKVKGIY